MPAAALGASSHVDALASFNLLMSRQRIAVEWSFASVTNLFQRARSAHVLRVFSTPVGATYTVMTFLTNCIIAVRGHSQTSIYFDCDPPTLREYLTATLQPRESTSDA